MPPNMQNCRQGERWDAWKGQCVPDSPLASALQKGGTVPTAPTTPGPMIAPTSPQLGGGQLAPPGEQRYQPPGGDGQLAPPGQDIVRMPEMGTEGDIENIDLELDKKCKEKCAGVSPADAYSSCMKDCKSSTPDDFDEGGDLGNNPPLDNCMAGCEGFKEQGNMEEYATCREYCHGSFGTPCPKGQTRDPETGQCWNMCGEGYVWDDIRSKCIPEDQNYLPDGEGEDCPQGQRWDSYRKQCISNENVVGDGEIIPPTPDNIFSGEWSDELWRMLSQEGWAQADQELWDTKVARMDKEYEKSREQLDENLNVRGLYYSGARADAETELEQARTREMQVMASEHENEMYNRRLQQLELATQTALGQKSLDIKYQLGRGELELGQIELALQEMLGMTQAEIAQQGLDQQMLSYMAEVAMAEAQTQIQKDSIRMNVISMLYGMGLSEEEVQNMWAQIAGSGSAPAI